MFELAHTHGANLSSILPVNTKPNVWVKACKDGERVCECVYDLHASLGCHCHLRGPVNLCWVRLLMSLDGSDPWHFTSAYIMVNPSSPVSPSLHTPKVRFNLFSKSKNELLFWLGKKPGALFWAWIARVIFLIPSSLLLYQIVTTNQSNDKAFYWPTDKWTVIISHLHVTGDPNSNKSPTQRLFFVVLLAKVLLNTH